MIRWFLELVEVTLLAHRWRLLVRVPRTGERRHRSQLDLPVEWTRDVVEEYLDSRANIQIGPAQEQSGSARNWTNPRIDVAQVDSLWIGLFLVIHLACCMDVRNVSFFSFIFKILVAENFVRLDLLVCRIGVCFNSARQSCTGLLVCPIGRKISRASDISNKLLI